MSRDLLLDQLDRIYQKQNALRWNDDPMTGLEYKAHQAKIKALEARERELQEQLKEVLIATIPENAHPVRREEYLNYVDWFGAFSFDMWLDAVNELEAMAAEEKEGR